MAKLQLDSPAAKSLGIMLILIALAGKLAFFQLRASSNALASTVMLESSGSGPQLAQTLEKIDRDAHGDKLGAQLESLKEEREELASKLAKVDAEQKQQKELAKEKEQKKVEDAKVEKAIAAAHMKEVRKLQTKLHQEEAQKQSLMKQVDEMRGVGTQDDEAMVQLVMKEAHRERELKERSVRLAEADRAKKAAVEERKAEAAVVAHKALLKEGLVKASSAPKAKAQKEMAAVKSQQKSLHDAEWEQEKKQNLKLASDNAKLEKEIATMKAQEAKREAKQREEMLIIRGKSATGLGKRLSKAGVVVDSWGPVTSTAGTKPDPRDTFAKMPSSMILPKVKAPVPPPAHAKTVSELERDLGFKSSILYSKTFKKEW